MSAARERLLVPLAAVYAAAVRARNRRYDRALPERLAWPVISVGNLSVGGAGKTPLVVLLAQLLARAGWRPDILSRGYGRIGSGTERVDPAGDAARFGDEPMMIARLTGAPVFVSPSRYQAGLLAERQLAGAERRVHLLDDGFQHRRLARALDVVAIHREDLRGRVLPAGRLREPLDALGRADIIVLREEDSGLADRLLSFLKPGTGVWRVRRRLSLQDQARFVAQPVIAFCAIARGGEFFQMLEAMGVRLAATRAFRDHHRYTRAEMEELRKLGQRSGAAAFITTEKDAVKIDGPLRSVLASAAPFEAARLTLELADEAAALAAIGGSIAG